MEKWLEEESKRMKEESEKNMLPILKPEDGKITEFEVDFSKEFVEKVDTRGKLIKIMPVTTLDGAKKVFWCNKSNPVYRQIIEQGGKGKTKFKLFRSGKNENTRYSLVE